jgi:hypothetical protein
VGYRTIGTNRDFAGTLRQTPKVSAFSRNVRLIPSAIPRAVRGGRGWHGGVGGGGDDPACESACVEPVGVRTVSAPHRRSPCRARARQDTRTAVVMQAPLCVATRPGSDCRCRRRGPEVRPDRGHGDGSIARSGPLGAAVPLPEGMRQARQIGEAANETSSYCPLPALRPSCPGGGSCRPGWYRSVTAGEWGRRGASPAAPRGGAGQPPPSWQAACRAVPPRIVPLARIGGPAPPPAARCRAPGTAARRGRRTAGRGCGRPGSASRRSAGCTGGGRGAWASRCICSPCRAPNRTPIRAGC